MGVERNSLVVAGLLVAALLAGCAQSGGGGGESSTPDAFKESVSSAPDTGVIRGLVLTEAIVPIQGANVKVVGLGVNKTTDKDGAFVFSGVKPGTYFLEVSAKGYLGVRSSGLDVQAGVADPKPVKIILPIDVANLPYAQLYSWDGFLECGFGYKSPVAPPPNPATSGSGGVNPCAADLANSHNTNDIDLVFDKLTMIQVEMRWEGSQPLGSTMAVGITDPSSALPKNFANAEGPSPVILPVNATVLHQYLGNSTSMLQRVFPSGGQTPTVFANQRFTVYTTEFHGFLPKEGWTFVANGECTKPADCGR